MSWPFLFVAALYTLNPVTISVYPGFSLSHPATFRITVLTPRHADNRNLCVGYRYVGEDQNVRESCQSMAGVEAARVRTVYWDVRGSGEYEAVAVLTRNEAGKNTIYTSRQPFQVIGSDLP